MKLERLRQSFQPLFGVERRETAARFLYAILISGLIVEALMFGFRTLSGDTIFVSTGTRLLIGMFVLQLILLFAVKQGYINSAAFILAAAAWVVVTYQAWSADGIRDVVIYIYIVIIFVAALLINWQISVLLFVLSILSIWTFAVTEAMGLRVANTDGPLNIAIDLTGIFLILLLLIYLMISTIRHSLKAVREGEEKFRRIFHVSPVAIAIASLEEGCLLDANAAYWKLTGFVPDFAIGKTTVELGIWSSDSERAKFIARLKQEKSIHNPAYEISSQSGETRTTLAFYELIDFERQPAVLAMYYDITEQKKAQLALQAGEQKYRNFIERSMEGIWLLAFDQPISIQLPAEEQVELIYKYGYIAECNDVLARMYGYDSNSEMYGVRLLDLQPDREVSESNYEATLQLVKEGYRSGGRETRE